MDQGGGGKYSVTYSHPGFRVGVLKHDAALHYLYWQPIVHEVGYRVRRESSLRQRYVGCESECICGFPIDFFCPKAKTLKFRSTRKTPLAIFVLKQAIRTNQSESLGEPVLYIERS